MKRILYDFCPKCSGLVKDGVCMACGYEPAEKMNHADAADTDATGVTGAVLDGMKAAGGTPGAGGLQSGGAAGSRPPAGRTLADLQTPQQKKHTGFIIGICIGALIFVLVLSAAIYLIVSDVKKHSEKGRNPLTDAISEEKAEMDGAEKGYTPEPSDEYYVEIVDALRDDLSYQVEWQEYEAASDDGAFSYYALFPVLTGEIPNLEKMNQAIEAAARQEEVICQYAAEDEEIGSCDIYKEGYVTYMDENVISVAFLETIYLNNAGLPRIADINIDVQTGSVMEHRNMVDYSAALAQKVRAQNLYQNNVDIESFSWSDEDITALLQSGEGVVFYTPVGLEVGFNYSAADTGYGWLTVTLKDYAQYQKKW